MIQIFNEYNYKYNYVIIYNSNYSYDNITFIEYISRI